MLSSMAIPRPRRSVFRNVVPLDINETTAFGSSIDGKPGQDLILGFDFANGPRPVWTPAIAKRKTLAATCCPNIFMAFADSPSASKPTGAISNLTAMMSSNERRLPHEEISENEAFLILNEKQEDEMAIVDWFFGGGKGFASVREDDIGQKRSQWGDGLSISSSYTFASTIESTASAFNQGEVVVEGIDAKGNIVAPSKMPTSSESMTVGCSIPTAIVVPKVPLCFSSPETTSEYSIRVGNIPKGHTVEVVMDLMKVITQLGSSIYDSEYTLVGNCGWKKINDHTIILSFRRWVDLQLACTLSVQKYNRRSLNVIPMVQYDDFSIVCENAKKTIEKAPWFNHTKAKHCFLVYSSSPMSEQKCKKVLRRSIGDLYWMMKSVKISDENSLFFVATKTIGSVGVATIRMDGVVAKSGCILKVRPYLNWENYHREIKQHILDLPVIAHQEKIDRLVKEKRRMKKAAKAAKKKESAGPAKRSFYETMP